MPAPLYSLTIDVRARDAEALGGLLVELGAGAVEERPFGRRARLVVYREGRGELSALVARARSVFDGFAVTPSAVRIERAPVFDWQAGFTSQLRSQRLTRRLRIEPLSTPAAPRKSGVISLRPGFAFGDGNHPTTRLAARALERACQREPGLRVLDVGAGSGVLSFVAARSGASAVVGLEIDAAALEVARKNARDNELAGLVVFRARFPARVPRAPGFDVVIANLEPRALLAEAPRIARAAERATSLLVTGFLVSQEQTVRECFEREGFALSGKSREKGWLLLSFGKSRGRRNLLWSVSPRRRSDGRQRSQR